MAIKSKANLIVFVDANRTSNGINANTGATENELWKDILDSLVHRSDDNTLLGLFPYDQTRSYVIGQGVLYNNSLYVANTATTGVFNASHWDILSGGEQVITENTTPFTGIEVGVNTFNHGLATVDFMIDIKDSSGGYVSKEIITASDSTTITINSGIEYANAKIYIKAI